MQMKPSTLTKRSTIAICIFIFLHNAAHAETVTVKYRGAVPLDTFYCQAIDRSSLVQRVCYDPAKQYMVIMLNGIYYHYCEIDQGTVNSLLTAQSMGKYFNANIKGSGSDGPFDCRTHRVPIY
jgi:KTSC domain